MKERRKGGKEGRRKEGERKRKRKVKQKEKNVYSHHDLWDTFKYTNIQIMGIPEGEKRESTYSVK